MVTTFLIETNEKIPEVFEYCNSMHEAKETLKNLPKDKYCILVLRGNQYGEGFHDYRLYYKDGKFRKEKIA